MHIYLLVNDTDQEGLQAPILEQFPTAQLHTLEHLHLDEEQKRELQHVAPPLIIARARALTGKVIKQVKAELPQTMLVLILEQTAGSESAKQNGRAYRTGADYLLHTPLDYHEIEGVLFQVYRMTTLLERMEQIRALVGSVAPTNLEVEAHRGRYQLEKAMQRLGILGESGCRDIIQIVNHLIAEGRSMSDYTLRELCAEFSTNPKTMEQRIRRAAQIGMVNIASLGIEDYMNDIFAEYSSSVYNFEQIKVEMDYLRKKGSKRGMVNIKKFLDNLLYYAKGGA